MSLKALVSVILSGVFASAAFGQTSWLDRPLNNWNRTGAAIPQAPRTLAPIDAMCRQTIRQPVSIADRAVTRAGWSLFGPTQSYGPTTVVMGMAGADGMCRPNQYNAFVFASDRFIGTLSPEPMSARSDGSLGQYRLESSTELSAEFSRYAESDALCCPSQKSMVTYLLFRAGAAGVFPQDVDTVRECPEGDGGGVGTTDNVVSGTVTYRQRSALPPGAMLTVRILDVSRADASGTVIAEQRVPTAGKQVPISFDLAYDQTKVQERNRYAVRAEIHDGERLLFTTDTAVPVITQGNPRSVEITLVPVGGGGPGGPRGNVIRGTVTYRQRMALPANSEVRVKLVDAATPDAASVADTSFSTGTRQVPFTFELPYEARDINRQLNYELRAEIRTNGQVRFKTAAGVPVTLRGNQDQNIELIVVPAEDGPTAITGRTVNISRFGTGSLAITGRSSWPLISASVAVDTNGNATVTLNRIGSTISFGGKMTSYEAGTLKITVENSGEADASGEITATFNGNRLGNLSSTNLVLDGQNAVLRF